MDSNTLSEYTFSVDEGLDEYAHDPYYSLLSMDAPFESTSMPIISAVIFLPNLWLGLADSHVATFFCEGV